MKNWKEYFPFDKPRPDQIKALDKIIPALQSGKKYILLQLGTGVGKSAIAITLSRWIADNLPGTEISEGTGGIILTSQKILQDQYSHDFPDAADLRSASNYECLWAKNTSCGEITRVAKACNGWPCKDAGCVILGPGGFLDYEKSKCPYSVKRRDFWKNSTSITNYSYMLSAIVHGMGKEEYSKIFKQQLFVLDECHRFEEEIRKWSSVFVNYDLCYALGIKFPKISKMTDIELMKWASGEYKASLETSIAMLEVQINSAKKSIKNTSDARYQALKPLIKLHERLDMKKCQLTRCLSDARGFGNYVVDRIFEKDESVKSFEIKPVSVVNSMTDIIYNNADHIIFMSATILDKKEFCFAHGISLKDTIYINIDSPFDPESFGITYCPIASMKHSEIDASIPKIVKKVKEVLAKHPNDKGIIHCGNYKVTHAIANSIKDERLLIQINAKSRSELLEHHIKSPNPTVLVSPSMMEGLDLYDDLGRFQIICKVPFPFLGDAVVKKIMEKNKTWYSWRTALVMIQSVGRCVRNEGDWAKTYILDECFGNFFVRWTKFFPSIFGSMKVEDDNTKKVKKKKNVRKY